ncbi:MAG: PAS domain-containing protein [Candidatus Nitrohelix vancouverensis]|uniref:histidine kinase n=1 Tax=Candidatus Nitrohelix vancouverensis TaxID=2705534 RepID=A0A7T0C2B2_9BACT|nr:MAG: PAS domain-containing protein [Candidatus Nitrohelix vancouverensis]
MGNADLFKNLFASLIHGVLLIDPRFNIIESNLALEEMFYRSGESLKGRPFSDLFPDDEDLSKKMRATLESGATYQDLESVGYRNHDASPFPAGITLSPLFDDAGSGIGAVALIKDLSFQKDIETSRKPFDKLSTAEALTLGMAHEIRNPLGSIKVSAQLLLSEFQNSQQSQLFEVIVSEVDRMDRIIKRMMDFSQDRHLSVVTTNIHRVLDEILTLEKELLSKQSIHLAQEYDPSLPSIDADPDQLKQVFLNLIKNSREAMPEGGKLKLGTRYVSSYAATDPEQKASQQFIVIEITDSGCGMESRQLDNLFTPFFTTKSKGSGLGLALSLKIIEKHNGKIKVASNKNEGTSFQVFLPIHQKC